MITIKVEVIGGRGSGKSFILDKLHREIMNTYRRTRVIERRDGYLKDNGPPFERFTIECSNSDASVNPYLSEGYKP